MLKGNIRNFLSLSWNFVLYDNAVRYRNFSTLSQFAFNVPSRKICYPLIFTSLKKSVVLNPIVGKSHRDSAAYSSVEKKGIQKSIAALQAKKRVPKKKVLTGREHIDQEIGLVVAYSSAEEYDLDTLKLELQKQGLYECIPLPEDVDETIHVTAKYPVGKEPRHIYFFSEGSVVFWNVPDLEQQNVLHFLKEFETNSYDCGLVQAEKEDLDYIDTDKVTKFSKGRILLNPEVDTDLYTYTFSNSLALSVKLAMWEAALENYIDSMEWVTENMKKGEKISMSRDQVFKKRGELFALRHVINLSSDLLDTPDFYWDRDDLENIYLQTCNHLNITKRTKVMNERLSYCSELIDLLGNHMNDKHHVRLEWMIIILIMVEVMFECMHFIERVFGS